MKLIMENWRSYLKEVSKEEIAYFGQAFKQLSDDPSKIFNSEWIEENIGPELGSGAFRNTYAIKGRDDIVFKVANQYNTGDASYMNSEEKRLFNQYPEYFPKVYLTSPSYSGEEFEEMRKKLSFGAGFSKIGEQSSYVPWIIVEKVIPFNDDKYEEFNLFMMNKYNSLSKIYNVLWRSTLNSGGSVNLLVTEFQQGIHLQKFLRQYLRTVPNKELANNITYVFLREYADARKLAIDKITEFLNGASDLDRLRNFIKESTLGIDDIRPDNLGTDLDTKSKLLFIDINKN